MKFKNETPEDRKKILEMQKWQEVPITVADITPDVCDICQSGKTNCPNWLEKMGLSKYCYESYLKVK